MLTVQEINLGYKYDSEHCVTLLPSHSSSLIITGLRGSDLDFYLLMGTCELRNDYQDSVSEEDSYVWLKVITALSSSIQSFYVDNLSGSMLYQFPLTITKLIVNDFELLGPSLSDWLTDSDDIPTREMEIIYQGPKTSVIPVFNHVNPNISYLLLPLNQDIFVLSSNYPRLREIGVNGDIFNGSLFETDHKVRAVTIWTRSHTRYNIVAHYINRLQNNIVTSRKVW